MADFRKLFYALAVVTLLAGLTAPAYAQLQPMVCQTNAGVPPIVRAEGFAELVGDLVLTCTGGVPTPAGAVVPPVNFTVFLTTNITSNLLSGVFNEALLIVDEPNSPINPARTILNCGNTGAPDSGPSGDGVCSIVSNGDPTLTYDGTPNSFGTGVCGGDGGGPALNSYGCGRPNVFQGRTGVPQNAGQANAVTFNGVPLDPPGPDAVRIIRITNIRADAELVGVSSTFQVSQIQMNISVSGQTSLAINNPTQIVAYVQRGLQDVQVNPVFDYIQCLPETNPSLAGITSDAYDLNPVLPASRRMFVRFREGFPNSWKTKGWEQMQENGDLPPLVSSYRVYNFGTSYGTDTVLQNVPGAIYNTESGFLSPSTAVLPEDQNPPIGVGTVPVTGGGFLADGGYGTVNTGIAGAGIATQGTRLVMSFQPGTIPAGSTVSVPAVVYITRDGSNAITGVAVRTTTTSNGAGAFTPLTGCTGGCTATSWTAIGSDLLAVYEVLFADPFSIEALTVPVAVSFTPNLSQNRPDPTVTARVAGGFAPFYDPGPTPRAPSGPLPEPRFIPGQAPQDLFRISKCACNLLFPYVTNAPAGNSAFDTGIALANTSLDPGSAFGFTASPQEGAVRFWYYNTAPGAAAAPPPQCTNTTDPGGQNGTVCPTRVPAGAVLTYVLSKGSPVWGLDDRGRGFTGYMIAQADFQYCHAFAYISAQDAGPLQTGMSVGYLGLVLDKGLELRRTVQSLSDTLGH